MKLKIVTLISFIIFVGFFVVLAFINPLEKDTPVISETKTSNTSDESIPTKQTSDITATKPKPKVTPPTPTPNPVVVKTGLTTGEVAKHSSEGDCYLIVKGQVYDVTAFIGKHPGGRKKITERCGQEATKIFSAIHSNFAWNLLKDYYVAELVN